MGKRAWRRNRHKTWRSNGVFFAYAYRPGFSRKRLTIPTRYISAAKAENYYRKAPLLAALMLPDAPPEK